MTRVLLGLGSNRALGALEPVAILQRACTELESVLDSPVFSSVYRTRAMYYEDQSDFYNIAAAGFVPDSLSPLELLGQLHVIEDRYGRDRQKEIRFGPRSLDIDIEEFGGKKVSLPELQVPHVRIRERAFVLIPSLEILTDSADSKIRRKYSAYLRTLEKKDCAGGVEKVLSPQELFSLSGGENAGKIK